MKMTLGAEPKKLMILLGLLAVAAAVYFTNSDDGVPARPAVQTKDRPGAAALRAATEAQPERPQSLITAPKSKRSARDFKYSMNPPKEFDATRIDPTLRVDLLAKLAGVRIGRVDRSLFDFAAAPIPKQPEPKIEVKKVDARPMLGPQPPPPKVVESKQLPAPTPPPPPITLRFFGSLQPKGGAGKRVFCLDGEEILTPSEGDVIKRRYKIIRIGINSVTVEDLDHKHQQTLPIEEAQQTG